MKILHVTKKYPNALGGDAVVVTNLEKQQKAHGHKVAILTSNCDEIKNGKHIYKFGLKDTPAALDNITIRRLFSLIMLFFKVFAVIRKEKPDVIHTHSVDMAFFISFAARLYKVPTVHTFHSVTFNDPQFGIRGKVELVFLRGAKPNRITVLSPTHITDFKNIGFDNVIFVPNGVDVDFWKTGKKVKSNRPFTFIAVGRLEDQKGFSYLIDAAADLRKSGKEFLVHIVGDGSQRDRLQEQIDDMDLHGVVSLLGRRTPDQLKHLYSAADAFVLSSTSEQMPLTLLEAWAAGLPSICTRVGSVPAIAKDISILIPPRSYAQLRTAMARMMDKPDLVAELSEKSSNSARTGYRWEAIHKNIEDIYHEVVT